jgi:hypothetical protein
MRYLEQIIKGVHACMRARTETETERPPDVC